MTVSELLFNFIREGTKTRDNSDKQYLKRRQQILLKSCKNFDREKLYYKITHRASKMNKPPCPLPHTT